MKLVITREQQDMKGAFGGHKGVSFKLGCRLELTAEETDLVNRYKLQGYALTTTVFNGQEVTGTSLGALIQGQSMTLSDVTTLIHQENIIKDSCDQLPTLFELCRTFGGQEVIEYPRKQGND
ncbi:hypothetical protein [Catenulispora rubra]|uniref:hypothetical protein n=1 Tax=Catenulispora rubra TaxID=280293 RepID=UPI0018921980|nr:hypothetical protein [Catenulispora rubra]